MVTDSGADLFSLFFFLLIHNTSYNHNLTHHTTASSSLLPPQRLASFTRRSPTHPRRLRAPRCRSGTYRGAAASRTNQASYDNHTVSQFHLFFLFVYFYNSMDRDEKPCFLQEVVGETGEPRHVPTETPTQFIRDFGIKTPEETRAQGETSASASSTAMDTSNTSVGGRQLKTQKIQKVDGGEEAAGPIPRSLFQEEGQELIRDEDMKSSPPRPEQPAEADLSS